MKKVAFYTLGCKLNFSETSSISRTFADKGFEVIPFHECADVYIINTCSVTENADKKCRKVVKEVRKNTEKGFIAIIGCYAQLKPQEIAGIPGVDAVLGAAEKFRLHELIGDFVRPKKAIIEASKIEEVNEFIPSHSIDDRTRTFLKVQDGCDYNCSFCTIPMARGGSRSHDVASVLNRIEGFAKKEVKEIVLTGVNLGDFGIIDGKRQTSFLDLVIALESTAHIERFRISSIEPNLLKDEIISAVSRSNKFVPHFHIPLQSGSDELLKSMRRRYKRDLYVSRVKAIKKQMPDACIGVDVIVGYPGETEELFEETYQFLNELDVSYFHVFSYSERANTLAATLSGVVHGNVRAKRSERLRILSQKKKHYFYTQHLGEIRPVLFEDDIEEGMMHGFTDNYIRVAIPYDPLMINTIQDVELKEIQSNDVVLAALQEVLHH